MPGSPDLSFSASSTKPTGAGPRGRQTFFASTYKELDSEIWNRLWTARITEIGMTLSTSTV